LFQRNDDGDFFFAREDAIRDAVAGLSTTSWCLESLAAYFPSINNFPLRQSPEDSVKSEYSRTHVNLTWWQKASEIAQAGILAGDYRRAQLCGL